MIQSVMSFAMRIRLYLYRSRNFSPLYKPFYLVEYISGTCDKMTSFLRLSPRWVLRFRSNRSTFESIQISAPNLYGFGSVRSLAKAWHDKSQCPENRSFDMVFSQLAVKHCPKDLSPKNEITGESLKASGLSVCRVVTMQTCFKSSKKKRKSFILFRNVERERSIYRSPHLEVARSLRCTATRQEMLLEIPASAETPHISRSKPNWERI